MRARLDDAASAAVFFAAGFRVRVVFAGAGDGVAIAVFAGSNAESAVGCADDTAAVGVVGGDDTVLRDVVRRLVVFVAFDADLRAGVPPVSPDGFAGAAVFVAVLDLFSGLVALGVTSLAAADFAVDNFGAERRLAGALGRSISAGATGRGKVVTLAAGRKAESGAVAVSIIFAGGGNISRAAKAGRVMPRPTPCANPIEYFIISA